MKIEQPNIIDQQEKEAKRLGITLEPEDDEKDQEVNQDDSEESPEEKPDEKIEEEESEEKPDESEDKKPDEKPEPKSPPKGSLQQEAFKQREQKRLEGIVQTQLGPITDSLKGITEALAELKTAKTPEAKADAADNIDDELQKIADAEKIPLERLKQIIGLAGKSAEAKISGLEKKINDFAPIIEQRSEQERQQQVQAEFSQEWESQAEPILTKNYENATPKQLKEARTLLSQLAVSADYGDTRGNKEGVPEHPAYPIDYIIYKEADKLDTILRNPKKKSFESSGSLSEENDGEVETLADAFQDKEFKSAKEAIAADKKITRLMGKERTVVRRQGQDVDITD